VARVLVACEFSGVVRDAFIARGHDAVSVDLLPTETPGPHYEGDVMDIIYSQDIYEFDLMIAHPPCTYLAGSGLHWNKRITGRINKTEEALIFVKKLLNANVPYIALENPVGIISTAIRKPDQIIQPWQFGHPESKTTCLWLKGLPVLEPTNVLTPTRYQANGRPQWENMTPSGQNKLGPSDDRWKNRSITYQGFADAMADQWGAYVDAKITEEIELFSAHQTLR
jgi:hypothetical protein